MELMECDGFFVQLEIVLDMGFGGGVKSLPFGLGDGFAGRPQCYYGGAFVLIVVQFGGLAEQAVYVGLGQKVGSAIDGDGYGRFQIFKHD